MTRTVGLLQWLLGHLVNNLLFSLLVPARILAPFAKAPAVSETVTIHVEGVLCNGRVERYLFYAVVTGVIAEVQTVV